MKEKANCARCGGEFTRKVPMKKHCSKRCLMRDRRGTPPNKEKNPRKFHMSDEELLTWMLERTVRTPGDCLVWTKNTDDKGYGLVPYGHPTVTRKAHRVMWRLTHGEWPQNHVLHRCDNRPCINIEHLFEGTHLDNMRDAAVKERMTPKLSEEDVQEIRKRYATGSRGIGTALAREHGVTAQHIYDIVAERRRRHVP